MATKSSMQVFFVAAVMLGLSGVQCDTAPPQQLRGNGNIAKKTPGKFDWAEQMPMRFAACEHGINSGTFSAHNDRCGVDAPCCIMGANGEGGAQDFHILRAVNCDGPTITNNMKISANRALELAKSSSHPIDLDLTVDSIQTCCHTGGPSGDPAHFTIFNNGGHSHRDCITGDPIHPDSP